MVTTTESSSIWVSSALHAAMADRDDRFADEDKWPAWRVTLGVVVFCTMAWMGVGYLAIRLLG